jgi:hypothetical protein
MTQRRDSEALLSAYFADGMEVLPDRVVNAVLDEIKRTRQRTVVGPWRTRVTAFAAAALVALLALAAGLFVVAGDRSPNATVEPSPAVPAVVAPSLTPTAPSAPPTASPVTDPAGVWIPSGTMGTPRFEHASVRLLDGRVLVVGCCAGGGGDDAQRLTSAELYDPATGTWTATGSLSKGLAANVVSPAILMGDGRVLVRVGDGGDDPIPGAEVYDPATGTWTATGQMVPGADFVGDTATLLPDGKVLVAGLNGAQLYDPATGTWSATGKMTIPRYYAATTLLSDGKVLAVGGDIVPDRPVDSAELYDPDTGAWTAIANMHSRLGDPAATLLRDGRVFVVGPSYKSAQPEFEVEVFDPATGAWTALPPRPGLGARTGTLLADGRVLVTGLGTGDGLVAPCISGELYDPRTGSWTITASLPRCGNGTSFTMLLDGTVLAAGGRECSDGVCVETGAADLFVPAGVSPPPLTALPSRPPTVIPSPTPVPTPYPPAAGPVPSGARSWTVIVRNTSSLPATLFVAEDGENGVGELCASVTPNVVPAGVTENVTFQLPPKKVSGCWIWVNPVPGQGGSLFETSDAPMAGEIFIQEGGQGGWLSP